MPSRLTMEAGIGALLLALGVGGCSAAGSVSGATATAVATSPAGPSAPTSATSTSSTTTTATKSDPVDAAFKKKVESICGPWLQFRTGHQFPIPDWFPQTATAQQLPQIANYVDSLPTSHNLVAQATALGVPAQGSAAWSRVLDDFAQYETVTARVITTARAGDLAAFQPAFDEWEARKDRITSDLVAAGMGRQSACDLVFARLGSH
jgi:hypothetical protein